MLKQVTEITQSLLHIVYPRICWLCGKSMSPSAGAFCDSCRTALTVDAHESCPRCSSTVGPHIPLKKRCPSCRNESYLFSGVVRMAAYEDPLREVILQMKNQQGEGLAETLGRLWAETLQERLIALPIDVIVPIPLHWMRRWARGYNQSEILARALARRLSLPFLSRCIRRIRNTPKQSWTASRQERLENVRGAFRARKDPRLQGKNVLLVDDVMTTGYTANEAARTLRKGGAASIYVAVLARAGLDMV